MTDNYASEDDTEELMRVSALPEPLRLAAMLEKTMQWPLHGKAADCLRKMYAALQHYEAQPQQEPVTWADYEPDGMHHNKPAHQPVRREQRMYMDEEVFYTAPAQQEPEEGNWIEVKARWGKRFVEMPNPLLGGGYIARFNFEPEQEPVAYIGMIDKDHFADVCRKANGNSNTPLYAAPPARTPLTDEEIRHIKPISPDFVDFRSGVRCAERAHGIKENT